MLCWVTRWRGLRRPGLLLLLALSSAAVLAQAELRADNLDDPNDPDAIIATEMTPLRDALAPLIRAAQADHHVPGLSLALVAQRPHPLA